jgi:hypothetical protein
MASAETGLDSFEYSLLPITFLPPVFVANPILTQQWRSVMTENANQKGAQ